VPATTSEAKGNKSGALEFFDLIDSDDSESITYDEFLAWGRRRYVGLCTEVKAVDAIVLTNSASPSSAVLVEETADEKAVALPSNIESALSTLFVSIDRNNAGVSRTDVVLALRKSKDVATLLALPQKLDSDNLFKLTEWFGSVDTDGDASISKAEFMQWARTHYDSNVVNEKLRVLFAALDTNTSGSVTRVEVVKALRKNAGIRQFLHLPKHITSENKNIGLLNDWFAAVDTNDDALVSESELLAWGRVAYFYQRQVPALTAIFKALDTSGNGIVTKVELIKMLLKSPSLAQLLNVQGNVDADKKDSSGLKNLFDVIDADDNDTVSLAEWIAFGRLRFSGKTSSAAKPAAKAIVSK
jgi:Ca2+-binding EF-hand superfamily protein